MCWLRATAASGWGCGTYLIHGVQALQRKILVCLHRYWLLLLGGLTLLVAIRIQYAFPQWSVSGVQFLQENLLVVGTIVLLLLFLFLWKVPKWQVVNITDEKDRLATESGFRQTLVQIVGGVALLGGLYFTAQTLRTSQETLRVNQKTLETTQQGQITERFTKAIEQLGDKERLMVRLGGIYALERIARDSESDHWPVIEVLTAFVREQAPAKTIPPGRKLRSDIQAILTIIGRRTRTFGNGETQRLDLRHTNLEEADLAGAQLQEADLAGAQLQGANLAGAQLQAAVLTAAQLQRAKLWRARLQGASLYRTQLQEAELQGAQLQRTNLGGAQLQEADLAGAQLQGANLAGAQLQRTNLWGAQLQGANLAGAQLQGASLWDTQFQNADLAGAQLQGANLAGAQLQEADFWQAQLQGTDLTSAKNLTQGQVNTACVDEYTQLPRGLTKPAPCPTHP
jgi:uncharacterized protein YjbI with pentapeptide repeats